MIETLKPTTGRMGVVVPHGVLFRASSEGKIRQQLIEENLLDTVIGLPEKLFFGTGIPALFSSLKRISVTTKSCLSMPVMSLNRVKIKISSQMPISIKSLKPIKRGKAWINMHI